MDGLPPQAGHPARALALGPDGRLYFSVAAPFNVGDCGTEYCTLRRVELNGTGFEVFARGGWVERAGVGVYLTGGRDGGWRKGRGGMR